MKTHLTMFLILCAVLAFSAQLPMETMSGLLRLVQTIPLPTEGYMDVHFRGEQQESHHSRFARG